MPCTHTHICREKKLRECWWRVSWLNGWRAASVGGGAWKGKQSQLRAWIRSNNLGEMARRERALCCLNLIALFCVVICAAHYSCIHKRAPTFQLVWLRDRWKGVGSHLGRCLSCWVLWIQNSERKSSAQTFLRVTLSTIARLFVCLLNFSKIISTRLNPNLMKSVTELLWNDGRTLVAFKVCAVRDQKYFLRAAAGPSM
jgi:hypothetical protein